MALKSINILASDSNVGLHVNNLVVPGVIELTVFESGNIHSTSAGVDLKGSFSDNTGDVFYRKRFIMETDNYASGQRFPTGAVVLRGEVGKSKMTYSMTQEKGLALYNIEVEVYFPSFTSTLHAEIEGFRGTALVGVVKMRDKFEQSYPNETQDSADDMNLPVNVDYKNAEYIVGYDEVLGTVSGDYHYSDFALYLNSVEFDSGASLEDKSGATVKFSCVQGMPPTQLRLG